jgi:muramidase (phage lysozyme)
MANKQYYQNLLTNPNIKAFLLVIRKGEGTLPPSNGLTSKDDGYKVMFTGARFVDFSKHPNILHSSGGLDSTAAGAYQFLYKTWTPIQKVLGLPDFQPSSQDIGCLYKIEERGALQDIINGNIVNAIRKLNKEWASLPESPYGQPTQTMGGALAFYQQNGGLLSRFDEAQASEMPAYGNAYVAQNPSNNAGVEKINGEMELNPLDLSFDFSKLAQNIENQELENTDVIWGSRSSALEESDFIGLKQYIIYLITRFYPQALVPFVEVIPHFAVRDLSQLNLANVSDGNTNARISDLAESTGKSQQDIINAKAASEKDDKIIDENRYNRTTQQLEKLMKQGGSDLSLIDPFEEWSSNMNVPNDAGKNLQSKRGLTAKAYGILSLSPAAEQDSLSKPGAIGLTSISIETGSQSQNGMSLVTIKLRDVQGNKLLDINSPWSFVLNSRPGGAGGDFYFRFGWQIRLPKYSSINNYNTDPQAWKFWNHQGWRLFGAKSGEGAETTDGGKAIKEYIVSIAERADMTLTFSQSITKQSLQTPGWEKLTDDTGKASYRVSRNLASFDYYTLTLINPEIHVDPKDGSIEATLQFRTNSAVANCLCPLNGQGLLEFKTKALVNTKTTITLAELMSAFVADNMQYSMNDVGGGNKENAAQGNKSVYFAKQGTDIRSWLTVIGGAGKESLVDINPDDLKLTVSTETKDMITNAKTQDNRLLIEWLNQVLGENNMALLSAADYGQNVDRGNGQFQQGFVIAYDSDKIKDADLQEKSKKDTKELAKNDPTFGDFITMVELGDESNPNSVFNRLLAQDDVFSFKFQGSLVEEISIEKSEAPNQATINAKQEFAGTVGEGNDTKDVSKKDKDSKTADTTSTSKSAVSIQDKKRNLNIIYSQMLGLKVTAICHPWIKLARPCFVKGMGFWDGKYMVTKIVHELGEDNKFKSTINAFRILDKNENETKFKKNLLQSGLLQNNPSAVRAETFAGVSANPLKATAPANTIPNSDLFDQLNNTSPITSPFGPGIISTNSVGALNAQQESFVKDLHPAYQNFFRAFIKEFEAKFPQYRVLVTSGYRTFAQQAVLKAQNANNASPGRSMHNYGLALDINIVRASDGVVIANKSSDNSVWINTGIISIAQRYGFTWGGDSFASYHDPVHFGLDRTFDTDILRNRAYAQFKNNDQSVQGNRVDISNKLAPTQTVSQNKDNVMYTGWVF